MKWRQSVYIVTNLAKASKYWHYVSWALNSVRENYKRKKRARRRQQRRMKKELKNIWKTFPNCFFFFHPRYVCLSLLFINCSVRQGLNTNPIHLTRGDWWWTDWEQQLIKVSQTNLSYLWLMSTNFMWLMIFLQLSVGGIIT